MRYKTLSPLVISAVILAACNNSTGSKTSVSGPANLIIPSSAGVQTQPQGQLPTDTTKLPGAMTPTVTPVITTAPATATTSKAGLNPEHGQPGHRCDIAVGAPLDSKPSTPTIVPTQTNSTPVTITPQPSLDAKKTTVSTPTVSTATKAGLNPEHGQPGHRCDIAVGAPLDSKPTTPAITTTPGTNTSTPTVSSIPAFKPVAPETKTTTPVKTEGTVTAPGMNPEHGKPGHRCDIAVGAPLDSKPSTPQTVTVEKKN